VSEAAPPRVTRWVLRKLLPGSMCEFLVGDLDEEYRRFALSQWNRRRANRWYRYQAARTVLHCLSRRRVKATATPRPGSLAASAWLDMRHAFRSLRHSRGFAPLVIVTLALGIGATTTIFSAVNQVMLRPLGFAQPERLVVLWERNDERGWELVDAAPANVEDWTERVQAFSGVAYLSDFSNGLTVTGMGDAFMLRAAAVSGRLFDVLGVPPVLGRTFRQEENSRDAAPVVVLGHGAWIQYFGGDPGVVGRTVQLDGVAHEVIGVMGPDFPYPFNDAQLWRPFRWTQARRESIWFRQAHVVRPIARLKDGVTAEQASEALAAVAAQLQDEHPATNRGMEAGLTPLHSFLVGDRRLPLLLLLGAACLLQLVACANAANLVLVRSIARRQETAVRTALGASRGRIVLQALTEGLVIGCVGGALGVALGIVAMQWISVLSPANLPPLELHFDWRFFGFAALVTGASVLLFSVAPALRNANADPAGVLQEGGRGAPQRIARRFANSLVVAEISTALMLVIGAGLMIRSLAELKSVDPGVDPTNVLTFEVTPPSGSYPNGSARFEYFMQLEQRLRAVPGVLDAGLVRQLPFTGGGWTSDFSIEGWPPDRFGIEVRHREASPGYFRAMSIPVLRGEVFPARIAPDEPVPVVVNRAFQQRYFPEGDPVGRRIAFDRVPDENSYWYRIVGVVGDERADATRETPPEVIAHLLGDTPRTPKFALKTIGDPMRLVPSIRQAAREVDRDIPLAAIRTMEQVAAGALERDRFLMMLLGVFATVSLIMACVGVYGVSAQAARSRVREIGIRMALGASHHRITRHLALRGAALVGPGILIGLGGAVMATRIMANVLYGVRPTDLLTYVTVAAIMGIVAFLAGYVPARRASRSDPMLVLREE
jgi:predicted permease